MNGIEEWKPFSWHCANCGNIVIGYMKQNGDIKVECKRCRVVMVRKIKGRRHDTIDVYAPTDMEGHTPSIRRKQKAKQGEMMQQT